MKVCIGYENAQESTEREQELLGKQGRAKGHKQHDSKKRELNVRRDREGGREERMVRETTKQMFEKVIMPSV